MKSFKNLVSVLLMVVMIFALAACGSKPETSKEEDTVVATDAPNENVSESDESNEAEESESESEGSEEESSEESEEESSEESEEESSEESEEESSEESEEIADSDSEENNASVEEKVVHVGTMGTYNPFTFTDDDNNLTGYDVEVVRLLSDKIPDVNFEFVTSPWDALFMGLDSQRYDMIANQIAKTPEREEKYIFSDRGYIYAQSQLVVHADDDERTSLSDFEGETLGGITGDYFTELMEEFNEANDNPYEMQYYGEDYTSIFIDLDAGRIAATLNDSTVVSYTANTLGLKIKCVGDVLEESYSYFVFRNDESGLELKAKVDKAMEEIVADGSLKALSEKWFGEDYTQ